MGDRVGEYRLTAKAGHGGMGEVFAAQHVSGQRFAIKTVLGDDPSLLGYFEREIATLASLRHDTVVPIRDHGVHAGQPWYAMTWLEGPTLRSFLRARAESARTLPAAQPTVPLNADAAIEAAATESAESAPVVLRSQRELLEICAKILEALDYVHSKAVVHGDLKPENIFIVADSRPVLVDFGVAQQFALTRESLVLAPRAVGSVAYMAPEQIRGAFPDARADLYALGCVLYECLVGFNPFQRPTVEATALAQLHFTPSPPSSQTPGVSAALDSTVMRLLSKSPADRHAYAREVLLKLGSPGVAVATQLEASGIAPQPLYRPELVGREPALKVLREAVARASSGAGCVVVIHGASGVGKTRLVLESLDLALRQGLRVFCLRCDTAETGNGAPLGPLRAWLEAAQQHALARGHTENQNSRRVLAEALELAAAGAHDFRGVLDDWLNELCAALLTYAKAHPTLVAIDDLDLAGDLTRATIQRVATRVGAHNPLLLLFARSASRPHEAQPNGAELIALQNLSREDVEQVIRSTLATDYASPRLVDWVHWQSDGNPYLLGQVLRFLIDAGTMVYSRHSGWHLTTEQLPEWSAPAQMVIEGAIPKVRLQGLSASERAVGRVGAVLGRAFGLPTLRTLLGWEDSRVDVALVGLLRHAILETSARETCRFVDEAFRELLYAELGTVEAKQLHRNAVDAIVQAHSERSAATLEQLAKHSSRAGEPAQAAEYYEAAGHAYLRERCPQQALAATTAAKNEWTLAAESTEEARARVCEQLGDTARLLRQLERAAKEYREALERPSANDVRIVRLHRKLAATSQQHHDEALRELTSAIALVGDAVSASPEMLAEWLQCQLDLMFIYYWKRNPGRVLEIGRQIEPTLAQHGTEDQHASYAFNVAAGLMAKHRYLTGAEELGHIERALAFYTRQRDHQKISMASFLRAMILLFSGDLAQAADDLEALLTIGRKAASTTIQVRALAFLCLVHRRRRAVDALRRTASATLALAQELNMPEYQGTALGNLAWLAFRESDTAECQRLAGLAMEAWSASATKSAFLWTALLPWMSVIFNHPADKRDAANQIQGLAAQLLDESQQRLPPALEGALEALLAAEPSEHETVLALAGSALALASDSALL